MTPAIIFFPIGNGDTSLIKLADGRTVLIDYADLRDANDPYDKRCDLAKELRAELSGQDKIDVVCFSHLDIDHIKKASEFFWFDHAAAYQDEGRVKIGEMWLPAGALTETGVDGDARVIRQEARHRLRKGSGIKIFSRPDSLKGLLAGMGLTVDERKHCIVDAGTYVPGFTTSGVEQVAFFVHSPFAWKTDDRGYEERNADSAMFQVTFKEGGRDFFALFGADVDSDALSPAILSPSSSA